MEKTPVRTPNQSLTSKFITPCRTFGLKRKSPKMPSTDSPISSKRDKSSFPQSKTSLNIISNENGLNSPANMKDKLSEPALSPGSPIHNRVLAVKNSLQNNAQSPREKTKSPVTPLNPEKQVKGTKLATSKKFTCRRSALAISPENSNSVSESDKEYGSKVTHLISSINKKTLELKCLKTNELYTKKHNLKDLMSLTDKWKQSCQDIVRDLVAKLKERGERVTIEDVIRQHHIPFEFLGFCPDAGDFV